MSTLTYPNKAVSGGGTASYVEGKTLPADELQGDFDAIATVVNGNIDNDNINASAAIAISKLAAIGASDVDDHSDSATTAATTTSAGDSSTMGSNLATDMEGELERLRYAVAQGKLYNGTIQYEDSAGSLQDVTWSEVGIAGPNLLLNSGFEHHGITSGDVPAGWAEIGTLASSSMQDAPDDAGTHARSFQFVSDANAEGLIQVLQGLKKNTKYLFGFTYYLTAGGVTLQASGGLSSGDYQNPGYTDTTTGSTPVSVSLIVQSDTSGSDIAISMVSTTSSTTVDVIEAWFHELGEAGPKDIPTPPILTATHTGSTQFPATRTNNAWAYEDVSDLDIAIFCPGPGYRVIYEASVGWEVKDAAEAIVRAQLRLMLDTGGGDSVVDGPYIIQGEASGVSSHSFSGVTFLRYIADATPGTTYDFSVSVGAYDNDTDDSPLNISPELDGVATISRAWARLERR